MGEGYACGEVYRKWDGICRTLLARLLESLLQSLATRSYKSMASSASLRFLDGNGRLEGVGDERHQHEADDDQEDGHADEDHDLLLKSTQTSMGQPVLVGP